MSSCNLTTCSYIIKKKLKDPYLQILVQNDLEIKKKPEDEDKLM